MADIRAPVTKEEIRKAYETGKYTFKQLSEIYDTKESTIKSWAKRDKDAGDPWIKNASKKVATKDSKVATEKERRVSRIKEVVEEAEGLDLTDKQRLFCHYYLKSFNQTLAAIKAGYTPERAHITGSELVRNRKVAAEIRRLKGKMTDEIFVDAMDVLNKYIKIAFSDMSDFVEFGNEDIPDINSVTGEHNKDSEGEPIYYKRSFLAFKDSQEVDGSLISEIKTGKQGMSVKLEDRQRALDKLAEYFDLFPDKFKRQIEEAKLKIAKEQHDNKMNGGNDDKPIEIVIKRKGEGR